MIHEALALALERLGGGKVVDLVASQGHCVNSRTARQLRHTLAQSELSGEEQLYRTVQTMKKNKRNPVVFFSADNKDFPGHGTADGASVHFITMQAYVFDAADDGGSGHPVHPPNVPRLHTKLQRKAPAPREVEVTHYPAQKVVPPQLNTPWRRTSGRRRRLLRRFLMPVSPGRGKRSVVFRVMVIRLWTVRMMGRAPSRRRTEMR